MQTRRKRNGELNLPSLLAYLQETNVLIEAAQEDIQTQVKGRLASFHRAMHICPHAAVNGRNSKHLPFPR